MRNNSFLLVVVALGVEHRSGGCYADAVPFELYPQQYVFIFVFPSDTIKWQKT
jgi:hypothetical protein